MKCILFMGSFFAFAGAAALFFIKGDWYGALGWFIAGGYQLIEALE